MFPAVTRGVVLLLGAFAPSLASADAPSAAAGRQTPPPPVTRPTDSARELQPPKYHRPVRSGAVLALSLDSGIGSASGYPNDSKLLNDKAYYGRTGPLSGVGFTLSVSGALTEYLNVGFYVSSVGYGNEVWKVASGGGGMRIDAFPFTFSDNRWLRHWAFYGQAGLGAVNVKYEKEGSNVADLDGTQSNLGLGSFYEFRFGALGIGPDSRFDAVVSRTASRVAYNVGFRLSFYPSRLF